MQTVQPSPDGDLQLARAGRRALWFGFAALLMAFLIAYLLGLVMGIVALYVGIRTLRTARQSRSRASGAILGIVLASVALVISLMGLVFQIFFWNEVQTYNKCMTAANTITDESQCKDALARAFERKLHLPVGSFKGSSIYF